MPETNSLKKPAFDIYEYVFNLEEQLRNVEKEKRSIEAEVIQLRAEIRQARRELNELKKLPLIIGSVREKLENEIIVRSWNGNEFLVKVSNDLFEQLKIGSRVAMTQRSLTVMKVLPELKDPRARAMEVVEKPMVSFKDVGGLEKVIQELKEVVTLPLQKPEKFEQLGIKAPSGVLLYGEPGTGKTLLAKALANECNATFIGITSSELVRKYIGEGAQLVRDVFAIAKEKTPAIIFIDEIDALAAHRMDDGSGGDREVQRTLMQLLSEMDGFKEKKDVKILGATNRIDILDPAILRPGRFDRVIEVPTPNEKAREEILRIHSSKMKLGKDVNLHKLAVLTEGCNGADISTICIEAGMFALRESKNAISMQDFRKAIAKVKKEESEEKSSGMFS